MSLKKQKISFEASKQFSKLFIDYVTAKSELRPFYSYPPDISSFRQFIEDRNPGKINRKILADTINHQYSKSGLSAPNIDLLRDEKTFTVCTGHQLCLFTGPLFFIYKIITTINLSEKLKKEYPQYNFVPVYWMASEDHDFEEISSTNVFGKKLEWTNDKVSGAVGRLETYSLDGIINELKEILGPGANSNELIGIFSEGYLKHNNMADSTRYIVHQLFGKYGLIVLDADNENLKREFSIFLKDDILNNTNHKLIDQTIKQLEEQNYDVQVNPREINCFYIKNNIRERIEFEGDVYKVLNTDIRFTEEEIVTEIELHPEHFSPNVVLRPLYQQYILPNLAYVGGPGELAYWLEYKNMFEHHKIDFPILVPRNFAILTDDKTNQLITKLGLRAEQFFDDTEKIIKDFVTQNSGSDLSLASEQKNITSIYDDILAKAVKIDSTLKSTVEGEMQKALNSLTTIESKLIRAEKQKQETNTNQIRKIKNRFFPDDTLQERYENISSYYSKLGNDLIEKLKNELQPFDMNINIIEIS